MSPVDGSVLYTCANEPGFTAYDVDGNKLFVSNDDSLLAVGRDGAFLTRGLQLDPPGAAPIFPLVTPYPPADFSVLTARSTQSGFRVVIKRFIEYAPERWSITATGEVVVDGAYALTEYSAPETAYWGEVKLDGDGALVYLHAVGDGHVLIRSELVPGPAEVIYSDVSADEDWLDGGLFVFADDFMPLIAAP